MSAAPGWYDAGTPGQLRWWDGSQWTDHEVRAVSAPPVTTSQFAAVQAPPAQAPSGQAPSAQVPSGPTMGWYPTSVGGQVRWWDGSRWTALRIRGGLPKVDWMATEQPALAFVQGAMFLFIAAVQLALGVLAHGIFFSGGATLVLAVFWFVVGGNAVALRRIPLPMEAPVAPEVVLPLPGTTEGAGAGWYPMTRRVSRWWTGTRWAQYAATQLGVRPTFHGARSYRALISTAWVVVGIGVVFLVVGIVLLVVGAHPDNTAFTVIGVLGLIGGVPIALGGAALLIAGRLVSRRILLLPRNPPSPLLP